MEFSYIVYSGLAETWLSALTAVEKRCLIISDSSSFLLISFDFKEHYVENVCGALLETDVAYVGLLWRSCSYQWIPVLDQQVFLFQLILGIPEQALNILHMAIEPVLAHGAVLDKGCAMFLVAKCQVASAASYTPQKKTEGSGKSNSAHWNCAQEWGSANQCKCWSPATRSLLKFKWYSRVCYLVIGQQY